LMHVEATIGSGSNTVDQTSRQAFEEVRTRAGITGSVTEVTKQMLLDERRVELAFENQRLFDLIRMGVAIDVLGAHAADTGASFSGTSLLLPIPQREIGLSNGLLTQNPGY